MLRPTIRADGSEPWFTWNPRRKSVGEFVGSQKPDNAIIVKADYSDNPFFPSVLEEECSSTGFEHIWLGDYAKTFEGAYEASVLADARREGRFCELKQDPILPIKLFWDIGGAGAKEDPQRVANFRKPIVFPKLGVV